MYSENPLAYVLGTAEEKARAELSIQQRIKYGVSESDTWSFDNYLLGVLYNGLKSLADKGHSFSGESYEEWIGNLNKAADNALWCWQEYDKLTSELFDEYYGHVLKTMENFSDTMEDIFNFDLPKKEHEEYNAKSELLYLEKESRKNELMDFIKEHFFGLWD